MNLLFFLCGIITVGFVLCISVYLVISGIPAIAEIGIGDFFLGKVWKPTATTVEPSYGILPFLLTSIYGTAGAVVLGIPVGLLTAVYLAKLAPPKIAAVIRTAVQLLAGIPSVVYGFFGLMVIVPMITQVFGGTGNSLLAVIFIGARKIGILQDRS